jgi:thiol-disulfide isomerase/thioredoxin
MMALASPGWTDDKGRPPSELGRQIAELEAAFDRDLQRALADYRSADEEGRAAIRDRAFRLAPDYADRMLKAMSAHPGDPAAVAGLIWIATVSQRRNLPPPPQAEPAFDRLIRDHLSSPDLVGLLPLLEMRPDGEAILRRVLDKNTHPPIRVQAAMALGAVLADDERGTTPERLAEAERLLDSALATARATPGVPSDRIKSAEGLLFEVRHLSVGKVAPELECADLAGKPARLSDFKGKVVVLDFWTTDCIPCRAMIPHERQLVQRHAGKPFALISISADPEKESLGRFLKNEPMPWTHWWAGDQSGVLDKWNVRLFPTIYVIDAKGTIRYKNVRDKKLDDAVETLLKEADAKKN